MMSEVETNKQLVREMVDSVWTAGDLDALTQYWTEDCINHAAPGDPAGLPALRAYHESFVAQMAGFSDPSITVLQQIAEDDKVVTHLAFSARHTGEFAGVAPTGRDATMVSMRIDRIADGKIAEHWSVADVAGLMQQLGQMTRPSDTERSAEERAAPTTAAATSSTLRPPRPDDRASIVEVARASGLFPAEGLAEVEATLDTYLRGEAHEDRWLIDDAGPGAAAVAYYAPERMTDGTWNVYLLAVAPGYQRQGRGARLLRQVEDELHAAEVRVLLIETSGVPGFAGQRAFYRGLGYHEEARIRDFYDRGDDKVVYWKDLASGEGSGSAESGRVPYDPTLS